jgi:peptidoglycan-associated lipoprotein
MIRKLGISSFAMVALMVALASCSSNKKKDEAPAEAPSSTSEVANKDMSANPSGSDSGTIEGLVTIHFDYDKATLGGEAKKELQGNAKWIKEHKNVSLQIEGHCDERGSIEYNLALGERRAKAVRSYLTSLGIDAKRLNIISYGKERPISQGDSEEAMRKNRRANFVPQGS